MNFQVEHHLFPRISHVYYPMVSRVVESTCREFGVTYLEHRTFASAMASHYRLLRQLGKPTIIAPTAPAPVAALLPWACRRRVAAVGRSAMEPCSAPVTHSAVGEPANGDNRSLTGHYEIVAARIELPQSGRCDDHLIERCP
jgi:hypothetical protein